MVNAERIKTYDFAAQAMGGSNILSFSSFPLNGVIHKVDWKPGSYASNGSYFVYESGTNFVIHSIKNLTNAGLDAYPQHHIVDKDSAGSGTGFTTNFVTNNVLFLSVSGNFPGSYFGGMTVYYK